MSDRIRLAGLVAAVSLACARRAFACGDKFLVAGRGTRYQRPKNARAANVLIYANPASGLPAALQSVPVDTLLKREGHRSTTVETLDQLAGDPGWRPIRRRARGEHRRVGGREAPRRSRGRAGDGGVLHQADRALAADATAPCTVKAPPKERSFLEAIDKAVVTHDQNAKKALARG